MTKHYKNFFLKELSFDLAPTHCTVRVHSPTSEQGTEPPNKQRADPRELAQTYLHIEQWYASKNQEKEIWDQKGSCRHNILKLKLDKTRQTYEEYNRKQ